MTLEKRIQSFELLGNILRRYHENASEPEMLPLIAAAQISYAENPWFTPRNIQTSLNSLGEALKIENLRAWLSTYQQKTGRPLVQKVVGVIMAGNIPAVGFHDFLCVLLSGHKIKARLSTADARLLPAMAGILLKYEPEWDSQITFITGKLEHFDAIIATGSNNSSRYFEYYFGKYPNIIRKNRNSVAVITGDENGDELEKLADDMMLYFGLGCRSISKLFVPEGYDFSPLIKALQKYDQYVNHNKYRNNYDYCRTMLLMNLVPYIDAGCLLLKEDHSITSRIAVLHYEFYLDPDRVLNSITENRDTIQCVVCHRALRIATVHPGKAQYPALWEYADEVDTLDFLLS